MNGGGDNKRREIEYWRRELAAAQDAFRSLLQRPRTPIEQEMAGRRIDRAARKLETLLDLYGRFAPYSRGERLLSE